MRYSRLKKRRGQQRYATLLVLGLLLFGVIYVISAGTTGKFISSIIAPIIGTADETDKAEGDLVLPDDGLQKGTKLSLPDNQEEKQEQQGSDENISKITESLKITPVKYYCIQMGAFNGSENANTFAKEIQGKGGAGYIIEDQYFRVIAMGFASEDDARKVREQLKNDEIESQVYEIFCPGANMEITAPREKVDGIKASFTLWNEKMGFMENLIEDLDTGRITLENATSQMSEARNELASQLETINQYSSAQESNVVLDGIKDLYQQVLNSFDQVLNLKTEDRVAISSKIKYTYIDMIYRYMKYMDSIVKTKG